MYLLKSSQNNQVSRLLWKRKGLAFPFPQMIHTIKTPAFFANAAGSHADYIFNSPNLTNSTTAWDRPFTCNFCMTLLMRTFCKLWDSFMWIYWTKYGLELIQNDK